MFQVARVLIGEFVESPLPARKMSLFAVVGAKSRAKTAFVGLLGGEQPTLTRCNLEQ